MRLFTGIDLPQDVKERLDVLISHLRTTAHIKWSPVYNLHITTKFIGEWPKERLDEVVTPLQTVTVDSPVNVNIKGLGWFPNPQSPRVFWAAVHASPSLAELARLTEQVAVAAGVPKEDRPFSPHLTLARIKQAVTLAGLRRAISELESVDFGSFTAECFYLYLSEPGPSGSIYTPLQEFPLPRA
jgi:RNA 2',3'-cyclic 3'-phosphodiesterase